MNERLEASSDGANERNVMKERSKSDQRVAKESATKNERGGGEHKSCISNPSSALTPCYQDAAVIEWETTHVERSGQTWRPNQDLSMQNAN